jgi:iron complex transport system substrate-binding protein
VLTLLLLAVLPLVSAPSTTHPAPAFAEGFGGAGQRTTHDAPTRIISLVPAVTEMLFVVGAGDAVIAVSNFDRYPPDVRSRPRVGALIDPDFERILTLKPDLVVVFGTQGDLISRLERLKIPIFSYTDEGLDDIINTVEQLGVRVGHADEGRRQAARMRTELDEVRRAVAGRTRPRTALVFGRELGNLRGIWASGGIGFMHDLLEIGGGTDVFNDVKRKSVQATTELLISRAPEAIIEVYPSDGWTPARVADETKVWLGLPTLPAVRSNRVYILADDSLVIPGPRVTQAARLIARALHPGAVK